MRCVVLAAYLAAIGLSAPAWAAPCPGNPSALGTSRVLAVDPAQYGRLGHIQYSSFPQLPLGEREVVLTFDDGPLPPYTDSVLKTLATECVKATFFMVGRQAAMNPETARRVHDAGHTIGTHSQNHPLTFDTMPLARAQREIEDGFASVTAAVGQGRVAPFFRIPGLLRVNAVDDYLSSRGIAVWSADADADDWYRTATADTVVQKAIRRIEKRGRGILLLHDIQPATVLALPALLRELKARGYKVVHVVPQGDLRKRPALVASRTPEPRKEALGWPRITSATVTPVGFHWGPPEVRRQRIRRAPAAARHSHPRKTRTAARAIYYVPR
jgi:peptidoglycan/xylan/chitin deacetylase (PgdA/CDA1 family)